MERVKIGILFNLLVLFLAIDGGNCVKCYICQSKMNPSCNDPFKANDIRMQECTSDALQTVNQEINKVFRNVGSMLGADTVNPPMPNIPFNVPMVCQKITITVDGEKSIIRGCQTDTVADKSSCKSLQQSRGSDKISYCDVCDHEGCNGVGNVKAPAIIGLVGLVSSLLLLARG